MTITSEMESYMRRAIELAKQGEGHVNPNPLVGAVIVKDGVIIGEGYHERCGGLHAERNAFAHCSEIPDAADLYVTLEPCCHHGRTPPCTEAVIENGIKRVFIGSDDPNPLVAGKGIEILRAHGIEVYTHVLKEECDEFNDVFFHFIQHKRPYVVMKYAMTLDGKIATAEGFSKWITGEEARKKVHRDRNKYTGIMVGIQTVYKDDPMLTCRIEGGRNPVRIVCDSKLHINADSAIVKSAKDVPTIIACAVSGDSQDREILGFKAQRLNEAGCDVVMCDAKDGHVDLNHLMALLGDKSLRVDQPYWRDAKNQEPIDSILLEGGGLLNEAALKNGIVQKVQAYVAPKIFGGAQAKTPVSGVGVYMPADAWMLKDVQITRFGDDILIEGLVK